MIAMTLAPISAQAEEATAEKPVTQQSVGTLIIAGGGSKDETIRNAFLDALQQINKNPRVALIPSARDDEDIHSEFYDNHWIRKAGVTMRVLHTRTPEEANAPHFVETLEGLDGVWMSGGKQQRLEVYSGTLARQKMFELLKKGGVLGGISAGAAALSPQMISSGIDVPEIRNGLGLIKNAVIDQHFSERNRENRLLAAMKKIGDVRGIGIDENTALVVRGEIAEVIGLNKVHIYFSADKPPEILQPGYIINFSTGKIVRGKKDTLTGNVPELQLAQ